MGLGVSLGIAGSTLSNMEASAMGSASQQETQVPEAQDPADQAVGGNQEQPAQQEGDAPSSEQQQQESGTPDAPQETEIAEQDRVSYSVSQEQFVDLTTDDTWHAEVLNVDRGRVHLRNPDGTVVNISGPVEIINLSGERVLVRGLLNSPACYIYGYDVYSDTGGSTAVVGPGEVHIGQSGDAGETRRIDIVVGPSQFSHVARRSVVWRPRDVQVNNGGDVTVNNANSLTVAPNVPMYAQNGDEFHMGETRDDTIDLAMEEGNFDRASERVSTGLEQIFGSNTTDQQEASVQQRNLNSNNPRLRNMLEWAMARFSLSGQDLVDFVQRFFIQGG